MEGRHHHHHWCAAARVVQAVADLVAQGQAVGAAVRAQVDIQEHHPVDMVGEQVERTLAVAGQVDLDGVGLQLALQEVQRHLAVVDQQRTRRDLRAAQGLQLAAAGFLRIELGRVAARRQVVVDTAGG